MQNRHVQMLMAATGHYTGGIDGLIGPISMAAVGKIETEFKAKYTFDPSGSTQKRRLVAAAQACLGKLGHDPGAIDGWEGNNTSEALNAYLFKQVNGRDEVIARDPLPAAPSNGAIPRQSEVGQVYGTPGPDIENKLVMIRLPFTLRIDWNLRQSTNKIRAHRLAAPQLEKALIEVHNHYGPQRKKDLGIDRYAGAYVHRRMRGSSSWSMHAYGCAIDFFAGPNGLRTRCPQALFCKPEYQPFLDIMEANEWLPALRLWGADGMHFQRARL